MKTILADMPLAPNQELIAFNKIDTAPSEHLEMAKDLYPQAIFISAFKRLGLENLRDRLLNF